jgi:hypothetical protein
VILKFRISKDEVPKWTRYVYLKGGHALIDCGDLGVHEKGGKEEYLSLHSRRIIKMTRSMVALDCGDRKCSDFKNIREGHN